MSKNSRQTRVVFTLYVMFSITHAAVPLLRAFFLDSALVNLTLMISTFASAIMLSKQLEISKDE